MKKLYGIYGASGFGREVIPLTKNIVNFDDAEIVFIDDNIQEKYINGINVYTFENFLNDESDNKKVSVSIADCKIRKEIYLKLGKNNISHWSIFAENSMVMDDVIIGENSILAPFVTLTSNIKIGKSFHANLYSYVAHDCIIGDFVTFAPGVKCNGNVHIGNESYIGTGAIIKQGRADKPLKIGRGVTVAAGAFVNKDIPDGITVFGSPAIELTRENMKKRR